VQVPGAFQEQMAQWRGQSPTAMMPAGRPQTQPDTEPSTEKPETIAERSAAKNVETRIVSRKKGMSLGAVAGLVLLLGAVIGGGFFVVKGMKPKAVVDPSNPQPLHLTKAPLSPPPEPPTPPRPAAPAEAVAQATPASAEAAAPTEETPQNDAVPSDGAPESDAAPSPDEPAPALSKAEQDAKDAYDSGTKLYEDRKYAQSAFKAQRCIKLTPKDAECYRLAGAAYSGLGEFDKAVGYYRRFLTLAPEHELAPQIRKSVLSYEQSKRRNGQSQ
jgi:hypothetical protein